MTEVLKAIEIRRSNRAYTDEKLTEEELRLLTKAALESPTARNDQTWHFSFVTDTALLNDFAKELRAAMGKSEDDPFDVFYHAPLVVFISGPRGNHWAPIDAGIAVENLALAAVGMDLGSVILGLPKQVFDTDNGSKWEKALLFPEGDEFIIAISIGHPSMTKEAHPVKDGKAVRI